MTPLADDRENAAAVPPTALVVVAAGAGTRMRSGTKKPYLEIAGEPLLFHTLARFATLPWIVERWLVVAPSDVELVRARWGEQLKARFGVSGIVPGGTERVHSVIAGVARCGSLAGNAGPGSSNGVALVAIHDGVRPLVEPAAIARVCAMAATVGAAILAHRAADTIKREASASADTSSPASARIAETVDRSGLWAAQTPQVARIDWMREAIAAWQAAGEPAGVTDDASLLERVGRPVALVEGDARNLKITTPGDLGLATFLLAHQRTTATTPEDARR